MTTALGATFGFFDGTQPQPGLELFRISFGLVTALYFGQRLRTSALCLGPGGLADNLWALRSDRRRVSIFAALPRSTWLPRVVIGLGLVAALGVMSGFRTQQSALVLAIVQAMLSAELVFLATGIDFIVLSMSVWLALSPAGSAWGIDAWSTGLQVPATEVWTTRMMQLQVCIIYGYGVVQKLSEKQWRSGWAVCFALNALGVARRGARVLSGAPGVLRLATWVTLAVQVVAPLALWWESTRPVAILTLVLFHLGLDAALRLWPFQWLMIACASLFVMSGAT